jgi:hypothetical protein
MLHERPGLRTIVTQAPERRLDPEAVCTRIVSKLIEELGCVDIAPDSPAWRDLMRSGQRVGELRVYRGRGRIQKIVTFHFSIDGLDGIAGAQAASRGVPLESHSVTVFTAPESPLPHFMVDSVRVGAKVSFHVDLLPKRDLGVAAAYLDRCFAPLTEIRGELDADPRFVESNPPLRQRALLSPWMANYTVEPELLGTAMGFIERYFRHWSALLRSDAIELASAPDVAARDRQHRKLVFSRDVDPVWATLDRALGRDTVDLLLAALTD